MTEGSNSTNCCYICFESIPSSVSSSVHPSVLSCGWRGRDATPGHGMPADFSRYYYCLGTIIFRCGCGDSDYNGEKNGRTSVCFTQIKLASGRILDYNYPTNWEENWSRYPSSTSVWCWQLLKSIIQYKEFFSQLLLQK